MDLFFYNADQEQCIKVTGVTAEPTIENKTIKGKVYRLNWRSTNRSTMKDLHVFNSGGDQQPLDMTIIHGGVIPAEGAATAESTGPGYAGYVSPAAGFKVAVPDDIAGRAGRQDDVTVPYWKVTFAATAPQYAYIAVWDFPSYGNAAPSWWVDPAA